MIGGLQGENGDLNNKYLKKKSKRVGCKYLEALRWISQHATWAIKFRKLKVSISQPKVDFVASTLWFRSCEMELLCCEMAHECQEVVSQLRKFSQRRVLGCEIISQQNGVFAAKWRFRRGLFLAAKFRRPLNFYAFELLLIPNFLLSLLLTFLLILIIQKPILHQNKLELKYWNQN